MAAAHRLVRLRHGLPPVRGPLSWIVGLVFFGSLGLGLYLRVRRPERYEVIGRIVLEDAAERRDDETEQAPAGAWASTSRAARHERSGPGRGPHTGRMLWLQRKTLSGS